MWDDRLDAKLVKLQSEGLSFSQIGERIGVSRNAAIGRYNRLKGVIFASTLRRRSDAQRHVAQRTREIADKKASAIAGLTDDLARGVERHVAIANALSRGATLQTIANGLGLTKQRVHQIANKN